MTKLALIIIYNHQYNNNIEIIEEIYRNRFSNIFHLVPFYYGDKINVISVYGNSKYFQGYIAQGFSSIFNQDFDHYLFIADDLMLNTTINERNYSEHLRLSKHACFLPNLATLHEEPQWWVGVGEAFRYNIKQSGIEAENQIPDYATALTLFSNFNLEIKPLRFNQIWKTIASFKDLVRTIIRDTFYPIRYFNNILMGKKYNLPYPMVGGYSDIFVVSAENIRLFCHYCGVFAATNLFVEVGLPTSMVLSAREIVTEKDLGLKGKALWTENDYKILNKYNNNLNKLLKDFPQENLYLHPIKLSKWKRS
jgi:hypothetical protein